jgi:hypothetical protein
VSELTVASEPGAVTHSYARWKRPIGSDFNGAVEVVEVLTETNDELEFIAAPKHIATRGDTLNCKSTAMAGKRWKS